MTYSVNEGERVVLQTQKRVNGIFSDDFTHMRSKQLGKTVTQRKYALIWSIGMFLTRAFSDYAVCETDIVYIIEWQTLNELEYSKYCTSNKHLIQKRDHAKKTVCSTVEM